MANVSPVDYDFSDEGCCAPCQEKPAIACGCGCFWFLFLILLPMSVVHVDVDEYAMPKTRSSAVVNTDPASLLGNGPHWLGPDITTQLVPSRIELTKVEIAPFVKNSGNELPMIVHVFWRQDPAKITENFKKFGDHLAVKTRFVTTMEVAMKGESSKSFTLPDYISNIGKVASGFKSAIYSALEKQGMGIQISALYLVDVDLPSQVVKSSLQGMILTEDEAIKLIERNASLYRAETDTMMRKFEAETSLVKLQGSARSTAIKEKAKAEAAAIIAGAEGKGLAKFFDAMNITDLATKAAYQKYLAILRKGSAGTKGGA